MAVVRFGPYELDATAGQLRKRGMKLHLRDQSVQVLAMLLEHSGEVVSREALQRCLWPNDVDVDFDNNLNTAVARLREVLGDSTEHPRLIETLPRRGYRFIGKVDSHPAPAARVRLLVLPFVNSSGDASQEYFSDAMTDEIIAELSAFSPAHLAVIARTTAMHYKNTPKDIGRIARELSLDYVVEGSTRRTESRVMLTIQLIHAADQTHLFARRYEVDLAEVFDLQRTAAKAVGSEIASAVWAAGGNTPGERKARRKPTSNLTAYNSYILARHEMDKGHTPQRWKAAREYLEDAAARDPEFALAYDGLADLWWHAGFLGMVPPKESLSIGIVYAVRAAELDNSVAEAHAMLAQYVKQLAYDWAQVRREMDLAVDLDPLSPIVRWRRAVTGLMPLGQMDEAIADLEMALEVDPLAAHPRFWLCCMQALGRHYERAIQEGRLAVELAPGNPLAYLALGIAYVSAGRFSEGIAAHRRAVEVTGRSPLMQGWYGLSLALAGERDEPRAILGALCRMRESVYVPSSSIAWVHIGLGEIDAFFEWMDRAVEERDHMIMPVKTYPFLDCIRDDARYVPLLKSMNLA